MKKALPLVIAMVLVLTALYGLTALRRPANETSTNQNTNSVVWDVINETPPTETPETPDKETPTEEHPTESRTVDPVIAQYWPEASVNLTGGKLGTQRVPFTEDIGDIHQLYFHLPTYTLFMSVTEPNGIRSVWQMKENRKPERVFAGNISKGDLVIFGTEDAIYVQQDNPCELYRSGDAFKSWHLVSTKACMFWSMAADANGNVYGSIHNWNDATIWRSPDRGFSWEMIVDLQKAFPKDAVTYAEGDDRFRLRHLHDLFYDPNADCLYVGTGDVARYALQSCDEGKTWKKIWDEGFTSHAVLGGGRYLLGPDQLHGHGIGLFDSLTGKTREVWNPQPYGYAGYAYSMANVDGVSYVALHTEANEVSSVVPKFGVIVSPDAENWYRFLEWGPLGNHARTDVWLTPAPGIIYASVNGALYAFRPLDKAWFADKKPFGSE